MIYKSEIDNIKKERNYWKEESKSRRLMQMLSQILMIIIKLVLEKINS